MRVWPLAMTAVLIGCGSSSSNDSVGQWQSDIVARAYAALIHPGRVVTISRGPPESTSWTTYVASSGKTVTVVDGRSTPGSVEDAFALPYLFVLRGMTSFRAAGQTDQRRDFAGRFHTGDSNSCATDDTIALDDAYLPLDWISHTCDGTLVRWKFKHQVVSPADIPADVSALLGAT
jgi:hypothetical protein